MKWAQLLGAFLTGPMIRTFAVLMVALAAVDLLTFLQRTGRHLDCKGVITGLGLLGTFIGIFNGLVEFDTGDIQASVPVLLEGLKFAFLTSILGMALAALLHVTQNLLRLLGFKTREATQQDRLHGLPGTMEALLRGQEAFAQSTDRHLDAIREVLKDIRADLYEQRRRFVKLGPQGQVLTEDAADWAAILDNASGLVWEHKAGAGPRSQGARPAWPEGPQDCVETVNREALGGFSDWRLPRVEELQTILVPPAGPDRRFFGPLTDPAKPYPAILSASPAPQGQGKGIAVIREDGATIQSGPGPCAAGAGWGLKRPPSYSTTNVKRNRNRVQGVS
jgi:hypothetical protein